MAFQTKKIKSSTLGESLAALRQKRGLTVKEVSLATMVQPKYIEALEAGDYEQLPPAVYVQGFLRALARVYHMNELELLKAFQREHQIYQNLTPPRQSATHQKSLLPRLVLSPRTLTLTGLGLLALVSLGYLYTQLSSLSASPRLEVLSPARDGRTDSGLLLVRGQTEVAAEVFINNQPVVVDAAGEFTENLSLALGSNQIQFRVRNKFGRETVVSRTIVYQEKAVAGSFSVGAIPPESAADELALTIVVEREAAWIAVSVDGGEASSSTMLPGATRTIAAQQKIVLTTGNAGATRVIVNGEDQGILGAAGEVVKDLEFINKRPE